MRLNWIQCNLQVFLRETFLVCPHFPRRGAVGLDILWQSNYNYREVIEND